MMMPSSRVLSMQPILQAAAWDSIINQKSQHVTPWWEGFKLLQSLIRQNSNLTESPLCCLAYFSILIFPPSSFTNTYKVSSSSCLWASVYAADSAEPYSFLPSLVRLNSLFHKKPFRFPSLWGDLVLPEHPTLLPVYACITFIFSLYSCLKATLL
jgi:hypothetical protein